MRRILLLVGLLAILLVTQSGPQVALAATFTVNSVGDASDDSAGNGVCETALPGECTLRAAIQEANVLAGADTIVFNIPPAGPKTIAPLTPLPAATGPVTIDGTTQPGYAGSPIIELNGSLAGPVGSGITLQGSNSVVRGLVINRFAPAANQQGGGIHVSIGGNNLIEHNYIGTDLTGTLPLGNSSGIFLSGTGGNRVGGTTPFARNIIADNKAGNGAGIWTVNPNNVIQGNYIGTDVTGTIALPNGFGLVITGSNNLIGGTTPGARNVISGNRDAALEICANCGAFPTTGNVVQGNYIGTNASGTGPVPNIDNFGGAVLVRASGNTIGGTAPGAGNVISGNGRDGVVLGILFGPNPVVADNLVAGNLIGTLADGVTPLGNTGHGVHLGPSTPALRNTIGGLSAPNTIAYNTGAGVFVEPNSNQNPILSNSIYSNGALGIDLSPPTPTPNDPGDPDPGANNLQNYPVITTTGGTLNSTPNTTFTIQFFDNTACDPSGFGEGETFISEITVTTDGAGNASFAVPASPGVLTATATDPLGNTSEFSACQQAGPGAPATLVLSPPSDTNPVGTQHTVTATVRDVAGNPVPGVIVRFSVSGANFTFGNATTNASGQASFTYTGTNAGIDAITAYADTNANGTQNPGEPVGAATKTWAPHTLVLTPPTDTNPVGTPHTVTATVRDVAGNPVVGVVVHFSVTGANTAGGSNATNALGQATFTYTGTNSGLDTITAYADTDSDGVQDPGEPVGTATKRWEQDPRADIEVSKTCDAQAAAGTNVECTVTVTNNGPQTATNVMLNDVAAGGTIVSATPSQPSCSSPAGNTVSCNLGTLAASASATVVLVIDPASDVVSHTVCDEAEGSADQTDPNLANNVSALVCTTIVAGPPATLTLSPKTATNTVDSEHCVTATVTDAFGNPTPGIDVVFNVTGSVNTSGTVTTDANGEAEFCYTGPALPGADTITAFADTDGDGTQDAGEPSDTATKSWVIPASTEGCKVNNGGRITAANGDKATFGGLAEGPKNATPVSGNEEYQDHGPATDINVKSTAVLAVVCSTDGKMASIFGTAQINGGGSYNYRIDVKDLGEPGTSDTYRIRLSNGYDSGEQTLNQGNVQIHK